jgi:hypothetical protein
MFTAQSAYHLPLFYPDLGFAGLFYCSRVRAAVFADYGYAALTDSLNNFHRHTYASVGTEIIFDTRWFNLADIPLGVRFSLILAPGRKERNRLLNIEFVVPVLRL